MYALNILQFHELSPEAQQKAATKLATKLWEEINLYGFGKLVKRKNAITKFMHFVKDLTLAQFLEDGTPVNMPVHAPKPVQSLSAILSNEN
jgi:hypothetical protein